eukprot:symbB.v1.2.015087.t1/scaffold1118.1/size136889/10
MVGFRFGTRALLQGDQFPVKKPSIKSTAGTLQDLGLVESEMKGRSVESTPRGASVSLKTSSSGYSRPKLRPTASK